MFLHHFHEADGITIHRRVGNRRASGIRFPSNVVGAKSAECLAATRLAGHLRWINWSNFSPPYDATIVHIAKEAQ